MMNLLKMTVSNTLKEKRKEEYRISQEEMATKCCISNREYIDLENGKRLPGLQTFLNIAIICKIDLNIFVKTLIENGYKVVDDNNAE